MPVSKFIRFLALSCGISLVITLLIPRDPSNAFLLGYSPARWVMIAGFVLVLGALAAAHYALRRRPALEQGVNQRLEGWVAIPWQREAIQFTAALLLFAGLYFWAELITTTDQYQKQILLRLAPAAVFVVLSCWGVLSLEYFREDRRKWVAVIVLSGLCTVGGIFLQEALIGQLTRFHPNDEQLVRLSQYGVSLMSFVYIYRLTRLSSQSRRAWILLVVFTVLLCTLQWAVYPSKYWPAQYHAAVLAPVAIFAIPLTVRILFDIWSRLDLDMDSRQRRNRYLGAGVLLVLVLLSFPYYTVAREHSRLLNYAPIFTDQQEYLVFAKNARLLNFNYTGDHNRMPGYPFLQALFYRTELSDDEFFEQGKQINILLSIVFLACMYWIFRRYLPGFEAVLLILIIAFSLYIFKAPYFQAEILFYFLVFVGYLLMQRMLVRPGGRLAIATGVVLGLAHLTKSSVIVGLILFAAVYTTKEMASGIRRIQQKHLYHHAVRGIFRRLGLLMVVFLCFVAVIYPYIRAMKLRFGHYFYNVNTTFYVWYDDNFDAIAAEEKHHFAEKWPSHLSEDEIPSLKNYLREHSLAQIGERIRFGIQAQVDNIKSQFSVTNYHLSYIVLLVLVVLADLKSSLAMVRKYPFTVLFALFYFVGYLAAFVWYSPISPERRFTYSLYIPLMFSIFIAVKELSWNQPQGGWINIKEFASASNLLIALTLVINIPLVLTERMFFDRYGS